MAKKKTTETPDEGVLVSAAKAIGKATGKVANVAVVAPEVSEPKKPQKVPKFFKKNKHRLPRREKKALKKQSQ
jgi:hypothetical protein